MELHLIRHPRPDVAPGVCYGQSDVDLAEDPAAVAARLRDLLPATYRLHASPLIRARRLAVCLGEPRFDDRLREIHFGDWELRAFETLGDGVDAWAADPLGFRAPGGESALDMAARVRSWLDDCIADGLADASTPVVVIGHGGPLRVIAGTLLGIAPERWLGLDFACGQASRLDVHEWGCVLKWFNR